MTRSQIPVTRGNPGDEGDNIEFDLTSDSKKVQAVGVRRSDDNKELWSITSAGALVRGTVTAEHPTTGIGDGRKVVAEAGTAVAIAASTSARWVTITAETDNTGTIVVGGSSVVAALSTRRGTPLSPGDTASIPCDDLADIYIDATVTGDGVTFTYGTGS